MSKRSDSIFLIDYRFKRLPKKTKKKKYKNITGRASAWRTEREYETNAKRHESTRARVSPFERNLSKLGSALPLFSQCCWWDFPLRPPKISTRRICRQQPSGGAGERWTIFGPSQSAPSSSAKHKHTQPTRCVLFVRYGGTATHREEFSFSHTTQQSGKKCTRKEEKLENLHIRIVKNFHSIKNGKQSQCKQ